MPRPTPLIKSVGSASSTRGGKRHYVLGGRIQKGKSPTEGVPRGFRWVQWPGPLRRVGEYSRNLLCAHRKHASAQGSCFRPEEEHGYQNSCFISRRLEVHLSTFASLSLLGQYALGGQSIAGTPFQMSITSILANRLIEANRFEAELHLLLDPKGPYATSTPCKEQHKRGRQ
jgi:hypothetical protein